ncbi:hypothetical protein A374_08559 [Fictibacillus macauensis ZFHKF-1]|uniref:ATP-grasp domain-containing protein n=1 Tax=Fictibacillus macauensis ZFHKF-1 TaxID=1196324 RepID=I8UGB7_9BACL|nr:YheC/YheD family protein [Fictibacillus macauensis]EIT85873.1 hypothetical protein A374_08559 [Fictibacillus macauensis ZFHKF-1]
MSLIPLKVTDATSHTLFIPQWLSVDVTKTVSVSFGLAVVSCSIRYHSYNEIHLSRSLWHKLAIPYETTISVHVKDSTLQLGPLIGIYTTGVGRSAVRPAGERSEHFKKLLQAGHSLGGYYFLFGPEQVDEVSQKIKGYFYHNNKWQDYSVPFPVVLYNQVPTRRAEQSDKCQQMMKQLTQQWHIPMFNPSFFNKWDVHECLSSHAQAAPYLPYTVLNPDKSTLDQMLSRFGTLFLKPTTGSRGRGVLSISKESNGEYHCRRQIHNTTHLHTYDNLATLTSEIQNTALIVQQGIQLLSHDNGPLDFRVHTNKDGQGRWIISAIGAKLAGTHAITTHLTYGGKALKIHQLFSSYRTKSVLFALKEAALTLSKALDDCTSGIIGEIGFDLGMDQQGKVWMIEANSKPGRHLFAHASFREEEYATRCLPLQFAQYLASTQSELRSRFQAPYLL